MFDSKPSQELEVIEADFKSTILEASVPVLLSFSSPWCAPCQSLEPVLLELQKELGDKARIRVLNTHDSPAISEEYDIQGVPTLMFFEGGKARERFLGSLSRSQILTVFKNTSCSLAGIDYQVDPILEKVHKLIHDYENAKDITAKEASLDALVELLEEESDFELHSLLDLLEGAVKDESLHSDLRISALLQYGNFNDRRVIPFLRSYLEEDREPEMLFRLAAATALARQGDNSGLSVLLEAFSRSEESLPDYILGGVGDALRQLGLGAASAIPSLLEEMSHSDRTVRLEIAQTLSSLSQNLEQCLEYLQLSIMEIAKNEEEDEVREILEQS